MRIGHGFDVHAFGGEGPIIIGGVRIPFDKGLLAHSDGDVALHALTDALLGAAALGDIGKLFPDTDPAFKGADSRALLREAWRRIQRRAIPSATSTSLSSPGRRRCCRTFRRCGYLSPKISAAIWMTLTSKPPPPKLGFTGRGEGIACEAVALLHKAQS